MSEAIQIYHTNDLHSHFEKWPRIHTFLQSRQQLHRDTGEECLMIDLGDHVDRWHPYTEATQGKGNVELLNKAGYDYAAIGNNEGITLTHEDLDVLYNNAEFTVLTANLYEKDGSRPDWARPYVIHTTQQGTRIGLFGLTANFHKFYSALDWDIRDPFAELEDQLANLKEKTDLIIFLSHLGIHDDEQIAAEHPEIDLILGAHTHHILHEGKNVNQSLLCGAGKYGFYVGQAEIMLENHRVIGKKAWLYDTNELDPAEGEEQWEDELQSKGSLLLQEQIVNLTAPLSNDWFKPSESSTILCKALREWSQADCAFLNAGLVLEGLPQGPVTKGDIHRLLPHPINPCVIPLKGSELKEILMQSLNEEWPHMAVKGFGFRGKIMGLMVYDQIRFEKENNMVKQIYIADKPLDLKAVYKLAIPDMFTFGSFFPHIKRSDKKEYLMPEFLRDIFAWKLKRLY